MREEAIVRSGEVGSQWECRRVGESRMEFVRVTVMRVPLASARGGVLEWSTHKMVCPSEEVCLMRRDRRLLYPLGEQIKEGKVFTHKGMN